MLAGLIAERCAISTSAIEQGLFYLTLLTGFFGAAFLSIPIGSIYLFPFRLLLPVQILLILLRIASQQGRLRIPPIHVKRFLQFLIFWLIYATFSLIWALDKQSAVLNITFLLTGILVVFLCVYYLEDWGHLKTLYNLWLFVFALMVAIGVWELATGDHLWVSSSLREDSVASGYGFMPTGVFYNPNDYATYLSLSIPFVIVLIKYGNRFRWRIVSGILLVFALYVMVYTRSRSNFIAVLLGFLFWLLFFENLRGKVKTIVVAASLVCVMLLVFPALLSDMLGSVGIITKFSDMLPEMTEGEGGARLNLFLNVPLFLIRNLGLGVGAGNVEYYMEHFSVYNTYGITNVHNWWVEILANYGIIVFVGYVVFYLGLLLNLYRLYHKLTTSAEKMLCEGILMGLVGFSIGSFSSSSNMALIPQWIFFGFALALLNVVRTKRQNRQCIF